MKATICLIVWMLISLMLTLTVIGLLLFIPIDRYAYEENNPSTWALMGRKLLEKVLSDL